MSTARQSELTPDPLQLSIGRSFSICQRGSLADPLCCYPAALLRHACCDFCRRQILTALWGCLTWAPCLAGLPDLACLPPCPSCPLPLRAKPRPRRMSPSPPRLPGASPGERPPPLGTSGCRSSHPLPVLALSGSALLVISSTAGSTDTCPYVTPCTLC